LTEIDDIRNNLEEDQTELQAILSSRYIASVKSRCEHWESALNTISEVLDIWLKVQRLWGQLESVFIGNEDIRQQIMDVAKNFDRIHNTFLKIMEFTHKNPNIYQNCCQNENRKSELKSLLHRLEQTQKKLNDYLKGKQKVFPRFYFISDTDLLIILGSSDPEDIQKNVAKLFTNCKKLIFGRGKIIQGMISAEGESYDFNEP